MTCKPLQLVEIFTDGACSGNPGPGGYGVVLICGGTQKQLQGHEAKTTNQRMELQAAIKALESLKWPCRVRLTSDSQYLIKGMTVWLEGWIKTGKLQKPGAMPNQDLWHRLIALAQEHHVEWVWVRGHNGHPGNEQADRLAREAIRQGHEANAIEESRQLCLC